MSIAERSSPAATIQTRPPPSWASRLDAAAFFLLLTVIGLRPLVQETYSSAALELSLAIGDSGGLTPAFTILMDALILAACSCWAGGQLLRRRIRFRRTGLEVGTALVAIGAIGSIFVASDRRIAINATVDWLLLPVIVSLMVQLLDAPWKIRLTLCVMLATGAAFAAECVNQVLVTFPDTVAEYERTQRDQMWTQRGIPLDDPQVVLFEKRLRGSEARGFSAHSNVAGSYLMLCGLAAAGLAISKWRSSRTAIRRGAAIAAALFAVLSLTALVWTQSRGAIAATLLAIGVWLVLGRWHTWLDTHRRRAFFLGWSLALGGLVAVVGHGIYHDTLPGKSLSYRWEYWKASAAMVTDHPLFGVGAGNFGKHYLRYKTIENPEEIQNPHNLFVQAATQWGVIGLAGVIAMIVGVTRKLADNDSPRAGPSSTPVEVDHMSTNTFSDGGGHVFVWLGALGLAIFGLRMLTLGFDQPAYALVMTALPATVWLLAFVILSIDSEQVGLFAADDLPGLKLTIGCALLGFLVHNMIAFAFFIPSTATTCFALVAVLIARPNRSDRCITLSSPAMRWAMVAKLAVVWFAFACFTLPAVRANAALTQARRWRIAGKNPAEMQRGYETAIQRDRWDPTAPSELAAGLGGVRAPIAPVRPDGPQRNQLCKFLDRALAMAQEAQRRDPDEVSHDRKIAFIQMRLFTECNRLSAGRAAVAAARRAMEMYPSSPAAHEQLGRILIQIGQKQADLRVLADGITQLEEALRLDDQRPADEIRRYTPSQLESLTQELNRARELGAMIGR